MRALSLRQAQSCENAMHPTCKCRCGGAAHGAARAKAVPAEIEKNTVYNSDPKAFDIPREWFEQLPAEDPHRLPNAEERKAKRRQQKKNRKARVQGASSGGLSLLTEQELREGAETIDDMLESAERAEQ